MDSTTLTWLGAVAGTIALLPWAARLFDDLHTAPASATLWVVYLGLIGLDIYLLSVTARAGVHHVPEAQITAAPPPNYAGAGFRGEDHRGENYDDKGTP